MQVTEVGGSGVGGGGDVDSEYTLTEALDDLCCRFLLNLPLSEFESFERLFFAIESAHWFYDDFFRASNKKLPALSLKDFAVKLFAHTPLLQPYKEQVDKLFEAFRNYKQEVPKCGAAMLNSTMDRVLLVHGWGGKGRWSFPKGKLGKDETELECARREVEEETGYNFGELGRAGDYLDSVRQNVLTRIFIVQNVPEDTPFEPKTRKEISKIEWHNLTELPDDYTSKRANKFYTVVPFVQRLKGWVRKRKGGGKREGESGRSRAAEGKKTPGKKRSGKEDHHGAETRASPGRTMKGKARRDEVTFGTPETSLNDRDREKLFQQYVEESERRREELDLAEYDQIVNSITFGNSGAEEIARMNATTTTNSTHVERQLAEQTTLTEGGGRSNVPNTTIVHNSLDLHAFRFAQPDILRCFS